MGSRSSKKFFDEKQAAAIFKHALLDEYFAPFVGKVGSTSLGGRVTLLDGYSGPGKYADDAPGSPALMVQTAENMSAFRDVQCIFVERDRRTHRALSNNLGSSSRVWLPPAGPIEEHLDAALERAKDTPLLAFLDPFGLGIPFSTLTQALLGRTDTLAGYRRGPITEVIMNFTVDGLRRCAGWLTTEPKDQATAKRRDKLLQRLDDVLGGSWWREIWLGESKENRLDRILDLWVGSLTERGWNVVRIPVSRRWQGPPIYYLIFMTQSREGVWSFLNAVSLAHEKLYEYLHEGELELETKEERWTKLTQEIERNIVELLKAGPFRMKDKISEVYGSTIAFARERHVRAAIKELHAWGVTSCDGKHKVLDLVVASKGAPTPPEKKSPKKASRPTSARPASARPPWESDPQPA